MNHPTTSRRSFSADRLRSALDDVGGAARPDYLADIVAQAGRTRQRPAWMFFERWLSMDIAVRRRGVPRAAAVFATLFLLVALLAAGAVYIGSQRTQPERLPWTERFDSPLNRISMSYPAGWQARPATEPWGHGALAFDAPEVDVIFHPTLQDDLYFALVSDPLDGRSANEWDDWCCEPVIEGPDLCEPGGGHGGGAYRIDGAVGFAVTMGCEGGGDRHSLSVATATRGYVIRLYVRDERLAETYDWDWFKAVLETVDLRSEELPAP